MKIFWLIPLDPEKAFQLTDKIELARALKRRGVAVETVAFSASRPGPIEGFAKVHFVPLRRRNAFHRLGAHVRTLFLVLRTDCDTLIFSFAMAHLIPLCVFFQRLGGKKNRTLIDIRTLPVDLPPGWSGWIQRTRFRLALWVANFFCDGISLITPELARLIRHRIPRLQDRICIWTSGVNFDLFSPDKAESLREKLGLTNRFVLIYHGILSPNRGLQNVVRAVRLLRSESPEIFFLVVGTGEGEEELRDLARREGVEDRVLFTGKVPYGDIPHYLASADMGVLPFPNLVEWNVSSPLKLMEYLAMRVPVLATDIPAHRNVLDRSGGGLLVPDNDPSTIAQAIRQYLKNPRILPPLRPERALRDFISYDAQAARLTRCLARIHSNPHRI